MSFVDAEKGRRASRGAVAYEEMRAAGALGRRS
jgi:hypothetical protein